MDLTEKILVLIPFNDPKTVSHLQSPIFQKNCIYASSEFANFDILRIGSKIMEIIRAYIENRSR